MKLAFLQLACERDRDLTVLSASSVRRVMRDSGHDWSFWIAPQDEHETWHEMADQLDAGIVFRHYDRGPHLNGLPNILGQIQMMGDLCEEEGLHALFKIDADVLMLNRRYLHELERWPFVGMMATITPEMNPVSYDYAYGPCYAASADFFRRLPRGQALVDLLLEIDQAFYAGHLSRKDDWPEDGVITALAHHVYGPDRVCLLPSVPHSGWLGFWNYDLHGADIPEEEYRSLQRAFDFVEFRRLKRQVAGDPANLAPWRQIAAHVQTRCHQLHEAA